MWKHHPALDFWAPSRRALTEQRRQRRILVEKLATTDSQGQSHPRGEQGAGRHIPRKDRDRRGVERTGRAQNGVEDIDGRRK